MLCSKGIIERKEWDCSSADISFTHEPVGDLEHKSRRASVFGKGSRMHCHLNRVGRPQHVSFGERE